MLLYYAAPHSDTNLVPRPTHGEHVRGLVILSNRYRCDHYNYKKLEALEMNDKECIIYRKITDSLRM